MHITMMKTRKMIICNEDNGKPNINSNNNSDELPLL